MSQLGLLRQAVEASVSYAMNASKITEPLLTLQVLTSV
jgi:hypothetical protein